jgi:hypothetical protein
MVMFDVIRLECDLPDDGDAGVEYRTNDLKNAYFRYHITFSGKIERIVPVFEAEPKERVELLTTNYARIKHFVREKVAHHGFLTFYSEERVYTANFSYGTLLDIRPGGRRAWSSSEEGGSIDPWEFLRELQATLSDLQNPTPETRIILRCMNEALHPRYRKSTKKT